MVALVFLYVVASIFIYGGELNATILEYRRERRRKKTDAPSGG
jgi:membrane protein